VAAEGGDSGFGDFSGGDAGVRGVCEFVGDEGVEFAEFLGCRNGGGHDGEEALTEFRRPFVFGVVEDFGLVISGAAGDLDEGGVDGVSACAGHQSDE
jgi:hypothetical protein